MKSSPILAILLAFTIIVLLVSSFFFSRHTAIVRANHMMTPAIENGWSRYKARLILSPGGGLVPVWQVGYQLENSFTNPLAVYVHLRGTVDDWEVREMLARYQADQRVDDPLPASAEPKAE